MSNFSIELNKAEKLMEIYMKLASKTLEISEKMQKIEEAINQTFIQGVTKSELLENDGIRRYAIKTKDLAATVKVLLAYTQTSMEKAIDMDKLIAKQIFDNLSQDPNMSGIMKNDSARMSNYLYQKTKNPNYSGENPFIQNKKSPIKNNSAHMRFVEKTKKNITVANKNVSKNKPNNFEIKSKPVEKSSIRVSKRNYLESTYLLQEVVIE